MDSDIDNKGVFYTDSNGLFEMKREKGEKWETSVFPVNAYTYIKEDSGKKLGYFTDIS